MSNLQRLRNAPGLTPVNISLRLAELASVVPADQAIVEIGVYKGRTVCYLAHGARHGQGAHVYGVDTFDLKQGRHSAPQAQAQRTIRAQGMREYVTLIRGFSHQVAAEWGGPSIGLLFVDGDHSYAGVRGDIEAWLPHLADGAIVAFDDHEDTHPEVVRAVNDLAGDGVLTIEGVYYDRLAIAMVTTPAAHPEPAAADAINAETGHTTEPDEPLPEVPDENPAADAEPAPDPWVWHEPPPRTGAGSGVTAWRDYAAQMTDQPAEHWAGMSRTDIIAELEAKGIIIRG